MLKHSKMYANESFVTATRFHSTLLKLLIPTRVLSDRSKVREGRHGTQAFGLGFQLGKSDTEFVNHLIKGGTSDIGKVLFAQMFPEMFRRIEFRAVGWLWDQADVLRHLEIFGMMPSRLIHLHHDKRVLEGLGDMLQKEIHHGGISPRQDQRGHFPLFWSHSCVDVGIFTHDLSWGSRPHARGSPSAPGVTHPTRKALIFSHMQHPATTW